MPSPFPGMDPYIESWIWGSFHGSMIVCIHDQLNPRLPKRYIVSTDLCIWREEVSDLSTQLLGAPNLYLAERFQSNTVGPAATIAAPVTAEWPAAIERKQRYLRVVDQEKRRVVTVIELLSPSNKMAGPTGVAYRLKREEYLASDINVVVIDLLRAGMRPPLGEPPPPVSDYYVMVSRSSEKPRLGLWPFSVRDPLPPVPIPLDDGVADIVLDLKACLDHVYNFGRYEDQLDYSKPPKPAVREPDATWARELLASRPNAT